MDTSFAMHGNLYLVIIAACICKAVAVRWDSDCGNTKGCFTDCKGPGSCNFIVTWKNTTPTDIQFHMSAVKYRSSDSYLAIGFSDDYRMGDDSVVACYYDNKKSAMAAETSYNSGTDSDTLSPKTFGISGVSGSDVNNELDCTFTRQIRTASDSRFFDLSSDYYIMLVTGEMEYKNKHGVGKYELKEHQGLPWFSDSKVDFQQHEIVRPYTLLSPLVKLHGSMMILAWVLFSWVGIMTARYNKDMLPEKKLFGTKVWFQVHRILMVAVLLCVVVGFISIFVEIGGYSQVTPDESSYMGAHPVLGIIITVLVFLNPIGAIFRPDGDHKFRWIFNWVHLGIGVIAQLLAVITIFFGYFSNRTDLSDAPAYVTAFHLFVIIFVSIFLEVRKRTCAGKQDVGTASYGGANADVTTKPKDKTPKPDRGPFIVLIVFSLVTVGLAVALLLILALS